MKITDLRVEYLTNPVGVDSLKPRFSWKIISTERNVIQKSWRILAKTDNVLIWDSGIVEDSESQHIRYNGPILKSRQQINWQVIVQTNKEYTESDFACFEMGLLEKSDWVANWIEPERKINIDERKKAPYLRREFSVKKGLKHARIYQTAHGLYETWINGNTATDDKFKPGLTSYYYRIQYQTYDITHHLIEGDNTWSIVLADGWWRGVTGGTLKNNFGYKLHYLGQIELFYEDGSFEIIGSNENFKTSYGGLLKSDMQMGEVYDARLEPSNWKLSGFDDSSWENVKVSNEVGSPILISTRSNPVREREVFEGKAFKDANNDLVIDFGQNIAGYVKMHFRSCYRGQMIKLTHGEELKNGCFSIENINKTVLEQESFQEVTYICEGLEEESYCPSFAVFGFRYVKVEGLTNEVLPRDFTSIALYSDMENTGHFTCSNELLNKLVKNSLWSQKGNFLDVPTDCPTRERNAWTGDNQVYVKTASYFMNVYSFYEKWLYDLNIEQYESGRVGITFPSTSSYHNLEEWKRVGNQMSAPAGPIGPGFFIEDSVGWGDAAVWIPLNIYLAYGDKEILINQYHSAKKWVDYMLRCAKQKNPLYESYPQYQNTTDGELDANYIYDTNFHFGEWLEPIQEDNPTDLMSQIQNALSKGNPLVATAYMYRSCKNLSYMANEIGNIEDSKYYTKLANRIRNVYDKYLIPEDGALIPGRQAPYVRVLAMDLCSIDKRKKIIENLLEEIKNNSYRLNTGFLSTPFILQVLVSEGYPDIAFKLLEQTECPSWIHPILLGSTTILEMWDGMDKHEGSYNHYSYGAVCEFLFGTVGGIQPDEKSPGYKHFYIKPTIGGSLSYSEATYVSPYGEIRSSWNIGVNENSFEFIIPANTTATIILPSGRTMELGSGRYDFID